MAKRLFLIVLDGLGIGATPDAEAFSTPPGSNALATVVAATQPHLPSLEALGLFHILSGEEALPQDANEGPAPVAGYGRLLPASAGNDALAGHWELAGIVNREPMPTFPQGFSERLQDRLYGLTYRRFTCNERISAWEALRRYGREHIRTGKLILSTTASSVMEIAAHETMLAPQDLYEVCEAARGLMQWENAVGRVIARPFTGDPPDGFRFLPGRRDYALIPPQNTLLDILRSRWLEVITVGKVYDLFAGRGVTRTLRAKNDTEAMIHLETVARQRFAGLCLANLAGFDDAAHAGDPEACAQLLTSFDAWLGRFAELLGPEDAVLLTASHGNDPSAAGHTREYLPLLLFGEGIRQEIALGTRNLADIAATAQAYFDLPVAEGGGSFLQEVLS